MSKARSSGLEPYLERYVGDARIAFVELRNEVDTTDADAVAWTRELVPWLRDLLHEQTPVTVSVGGNAPAHDLRALVAALPADARPDFFDAHYFTGGGEQAQQVFATLRKLADPTPLWIGELGYPTSTTHSGYPGVPLTPSAQEAAQAHYFKLCFGALARLGLPAPGSGSSTTSRREPFRNRMLTAERRNTGSVSFAGTARRSRQRSRSADSSGGSSRRGSTEASKRLPPRRTEPPCQPSGARRAS